MSMLCSLYRLTEQQTLNLLSDHASVNDLLGNSQPPPKSSFFSKIFGQSKTDVPPVKQKLEPVAESETFELNQAWHILHYLFSGSDAEGDWPSTFIMFGGQAIGPDLGYGPPRLLTTELSADVSKFLSTLSRQSLDAAYVAQNIEDAKIYWHVCSEHSDRQGQIEELWDIVLNMRDFIEETVVLHGSILVQIY
ncbi:MAG TPA: DUF1877 domain-containing protein [Planctomycetaceae bacterium]|nr:DUF1877 domain-containing protein [Planctomycetaceae bacterium]